MVIKDYIFNDQYLFLKTRSHDQSFYSLNNRTKLCCCIEISRTPLLIGKIYTTLVNAPVSLLEKIQSMMWIKFILTISCFWGTLFCHSRYSICQRTFVIDISFTIYSILWTVIKAELILFQLSPTIIKATVCKNLP